MFAKPFQRWFNAEARFSKRKDMAAKRGPMLLRMLLSVCVIESEKAADELLAVK